MKQTQNLFTTSLLLVIEIQSKFVIIISLFAYSYFNNVDNLALMTFPQDPIKCNHPINDLVEKLMYTYNYPYAFQLVSQSGVLQSF